MSNLFYTIQEDGDEREVRGPFRTKDDALRDARIRLVAAYIRLVAAYKSACGCLRDNHDGSWTRPVAIVQHIGNYEPQYNVTVQLKEVRP
jgi:hypothetical protein